MARQALTAGAWIRTAHVRSLPDVEAGEEILLLTRAGEATVSIAGRVRRAGFVGDMILVLNPLTGSVVRARLLESGHAELIPQQVRAESRTERSAT